jgi:hypothetical protein
MFFSSSLQKKYTVLTLHADEGILHFLFIFEELMFFLVILATLKPSIDCEIVNGLCAIDSRKNPSYILLNAIAVIRYQSLSP